MEKKSNMHSKDIKISDTIDSESKKDIEILSNEAEYLNDIDEVFDKDEKIAELEKMIEAKNRECEILNDRTLRMQADFENYKRRTLKEKEEIQQKSTISTVLMMLPVYDNMQRAVNSTDVASIEGMRSGTEMIFKQFENVFEQLGMEKIPSEEVEFDPECHEAVCVEESKEHKDNHVIQELQTGFRMGGQLVRPAIVKVCRNCEDNR